MNQNNNPVVIVDVDGTLIDISHWPELGPPVSGAREKLEELKSKGYRIIIWSARYSSRASHPNNIVLERTPREKEIAIRQLERWLDKHKIPYDEIWRADKPSGILIDDRCINIQETSWNNLDI